MSGEIIPIYSGNLPMNTAAAISGSGTNFREALKVQGKFDILYENGIIEKKPFEFSAVVCNKPEAKGLGYARNREPKIPEVVVSSKDFFDALGVKPNNEEHRPEYDSVILDRLEREKHKVDHFALLGWDRKLSSKFIEYYKEKGVFGTNVHPSRDPINIGGTMGAVQQAFDLGEQKIRSTLQMVDVVLDHGKFIAQSEWVNTGEALPEGWRKSGMDNEGILNTFIEWKKQEGKTFETMEEAKKEYCGNLQDILKQRGDWVIVPFGLYNNAEEKFGRDKEGNVYSKINSKNWKPLGKWGYQVDKEGLGEYGKLMKKADELMAEAVA
ncbi:MAG: formyltransferase family protein [Candidatus Aenigmatarchaeota archaeon]